MNNDKYAQGDIYNDDDNGCFKVNYKVIKLT